MARKFTLFIDDTSIKLLIATGERVEKWATMPLAPGLVSGGTVVDEEKVAQHLREQLRLLRITSKRVIIGLSGRNSLYRLISLPQVPDAILPEAVRREAERVLPVSLDDVYLAFQPVPGKGEGRRHVFLAVFPRNVADSVARTVMKAGLEPYLMDLAPLALCRLISVPKAIAASVQGSGLDIIVMVNMVPQVIRSLPLPGDTEAASERLVTVAEEIDRTVAFYNSSHEDSPLDNTVPLLLSGDLAQAPESQELLASRLGYPVSALLSPINSQTAFDSYQYMVNVGLALKEVSRGKGLPEFSLVNVDVLPDGYRVKHVSPVNVVAPVGVVLFMSLIIITVVLMSSAGRYVSALHSELATLQSYASSQQEDITAMKDNIKQLGDQVKPVAAKTGSLNARWNSLVAGRLGLDENVNQVVQLLPSQVTLVALSHTAGLVTLRGVANSEGDIDAYARLLRATGRFDIAAINIDLVTVTVATEGTEGTEGTEVAEVMEKYGFELFLKSK